MSLFWGLVPMLFYHCVRTNDRVPAMMSGSSPESRDVLRSQHQELLQTC